MSLKLPVVHLDASPTQLAEQVKRACENEGFFYLAASPYIQPADVDRAFELSEAVYKDRSPVALADLEATADRAANAGYVRIGSEALEPGKQDVKECFMLKRFEPSTDLTPAQPLPRVWSDAEARAELKNFWEACFATSLLVLKGFAQALGLPQDFFTKWHHGQLDRLRFLHYPPTEVSTAPEHGNFIRAGAHTDYGSVTLLFQKDVGGLQVDLEHKTETNPDAGPEVWTDIPPTRGMIVCNVGDAIQFWSAGIYKSTVHRVAMPASQEQNQSRYSIAFFSQPDQDAPLQPLAELHDVQTSGAWQSESAAFNAKFASLPKDRVVTGGEYLAARLRATY